MYLQAYDRGTLLFKVEFLGKENDEVYCGAFLAFKADHTVEEFHIFNMIYKFNVNSLGLQTF